MSLTSRFLTAAALLLLGNMALAADFNAETYHESNCIRCHDTSVYTRETRKMRSYGMLQSRVKGCDARFGEKLAEQDLTGLVDHLNDSYYQFSK